jgi:hypothetical protein
VSGRIVTPPRLSAIRIVLPRSDLDLPPLEVEPTGEQRQGEAVLVLGAGQRRVWLRPWGETRTRSASGSPCFATAARPV